MIEQWTEIGKVFFNRPKSCLRSLFCLKFVNNQSENVRNALQRLGKLFCFCKIANIYAIR